MEIKDVEPMPACFGIVPYIIPFIYLYETLRIEINAELTSHSLYQCRHYQGRNDTSSIGNTMSKLMSEFSNI